MNIKLKERYKPFSHEAGTPLLIPQSSWKMTPYPGRVLLENLIPANKKETITFFLQIDQPLKTFTIMQDLEKGCVTIFGIGNKGYFSYRLSSIADNIFLSVHRCPQEGLFFSFEGSLKNLKRKERIPILVRPSRSYPNSLEKMHFGVSKKQDWALIKRRLSVKEILPIWFQLGKNIPKQPILNVGTSKYLKICNDLLIQQNRVKIGNMLLELFKVGFEGILSPRLLDTDYQIKHTDHNLLKGVSPILLLGEGARLIRRLLIEIHGEKLTILPCLPKEIDAGCFVAIDVTSNLSIDLEWSKKLIRRLTLLSKTNQTITLLFQKPIVSFRLRKRHQQRGYSIAVETPLQLKKDTFYILDRFQKS